MLHPDPLSADTKTKLIPLSPAERAYFEELVPAEHFLRRLPLAVDFEIFRPVLAARYSANHGSPAVDPVFMLKLETIARQYKYSDREVMMATRFNIAYRLFLGVSLKSPLPHHTLLTKFRNRVSADLQQIFDTLVGHARELGLVKDRLRLKDATHIIANMAVPSTIRLVAEVRDQLLQALLPFAPGQAMAEQQRAEAIHLGSADAKDDERLLQRVDHLRAVLIWADEVPRQDGFRQQPECSQQQLLAALALAHKILADREDPKATDKVLSVHDPDARRGMHGDYYEGFLLDVAMDADSEIITAVNVLPANGDEGADTATLIRQEEQAHGNDVEAVSADGAVYRGAVLRELTAADGLNLEVFTPPTQMPAPTVFGAERFTLTVLGDQPTLSCPAGQTTQQRQRSRHDTGWKFQFSKRQCTGCPLREQCLTNPQSRKGRTVTKNDYEAEYVAAQAKAQTPEYAEVRRRHPAIERKLSELVRRHDLRHARYRGRARVLYQGMLTCLVVNLKRIVRLLFAPAKDAAQTVRAALAAGG
jgi:transposase